MDEPSFPRLTQLCRAFDIPSTSSIATITRKRRAEVLSESVAPEMAPVKRPSSAVGAGNLFCIGAFFVSLRVLVPHIPLLLLFHLCVVRYIYFRKKI